MFSVLFITHWSDLCGSRVGPLCNRCVSGRIRKGGERWGSGDGCGCGGRKPGGCGEEAVHKLHK
ncbi:hypothetical protein E2C01_082145 [Portunus trituberculatus]|uniref:Uncharacterized protein n=1 Tax=Portunus trituberculatus TaxID=210409 RepID=A0A5B7J0S6_PORTR|nr:hypothetical protein [Portunus trituberculatus]